MYISLKRKKFKYPLNKYNLYLINDRCNNRKNDTKIIKIW